MDFYGVWKRKGVVRVTPWRRNPATGVWEPGDHEQFPNLIVDGGFNILRDALGSSAVKTQISYVALGNGASAPAAGDEILGDERFRKQSTDYTTGAIGEMTTTVYVSPGEANDFTIEEIGWFAGEATNAADTGTLVARVNYNRAKNTNEAIQIDRTDTFA